MFRNPEFFRHPTPIKPCRAQIGNHVVWHQQGGREAVGLRFLGRPNVAVVKASLAGTSIGTIVINALINKVSVVDVVADFMSYGEPLPR